jgi:hypothetical protein
LAREFSRVAAAAEILVIVSVVTLHVFLTGLFEKDFDEIRFVQRVWLSIGFVSLLILAATILATEGDP